MTLCSGTAECPVVTIQATSALSQKALGESRLEVLGCQATKGSTHPASPPAPGASGHCSGKAAGVGFMDWQWETDDWHYWWPV